MTKRASQFGWQPLVYAALLLLTLLAGIFLYRSIHRASAADRMQQRELLETAIRGTASEFNNAIQEVLNTFRPVPRVQNDGKLNAYALELYHTWRGTTQRNPLIGSLSVASVANGTPEFRRYQPPTQTTVSENEAVFETAEWPAALQAFRAALPVKPAAPLRLPPTGYAFVLSENRPVIALPLMTINVATHTVRTLPPTFSGPPPTRPGVGNPPAGAIPPFRNGPPPWVTQGQPPPWLSPGQAPPWAGRRTPGAPGRNDLRLQLAGWCFVEFDAAYLREHLLPELQRKHFSGADLSNYVLVVSAERDTPPLYISDATFKLTTTADATQTLYAPLSRMGESFDARLTEKNHAAPWQLAAYHRAGSLTAVLQRERRNHLLIGFGLLFLLSGTVSLLAWTAQRSRALARRQMEFVAGVSHELRTPLSVIQSAGFNLAQGRVSDPVRVAQYGATIQQEGRRLSEMVEQMLSYAGIQAGRKQYEFQATRVEDLIDRAMSEYEATFAANGWQIEKAIDTDLPLIHADQQALESAVKNLLQNALKYAANGKWLRVSARQAGQEIQITVADHGPGIAAEDLRNLFEPFYRGRGMSASALPGAGLGLSILRHHLKAHGGRVTVDSSDTGAAFTLHLPALLTTEHEQTAETLHLVD
jgi:signal transduction histidine kinase